MATAASLVKLQVARRLLRGRSVRSMSVIELAAASGVAAAEINLFEAGEIVPGLLQLHAIAAVLDVPLCFFFGDDPHLEPASTLQDELLLASFRSIPAREQSAVIELVREIAAVIERSYPLFFREDLE